MGNCIGGKELPGGSFAVKHKTRSYIERKSIKREAANCRAQLHESMLQVHVIAELGGDNTQVRDKYDLQGGKDGVLGEGLCGKVVVATHKKTGRKYACKVLKLNRIDTERLEELRREIRIMMRLDHPNIVKLYEVFEERDRMYLIMELLSGGELFDSLSNQKNYHFTERRAAEMVKCILSALYYVHTKSIVHRDLKLENIMLSSKTADKTLKLIDFGLSLKFRGGVLHERLGTPYYIAPEVLKGSYTISCDIWSVGVITYMLLSGRPPFDGDTDEEIFKAVAKAKVSFPKNAFRGVSTCAQHFIRHLLERDVDKRVTAEQALQHKWIQRLTRGPSSSSGANSGSSRNGSSTSSSTGEAGRKRQSSDGSFVAEISGNGVSSPSLGRSESSQSEGNGTASPGQGSHKLSANVVSGIRAFSKLTAFKRAAMFAMAFNMDQSQICNIQKAFQEIDVHNDGLVTYSEFYTVLIENGMCEDEIKKSFECLDLEHTKAIEYTQFVAAALSERIFRDEEQVHAAFHMMDTDNDGKIDKNDLRKVLGDRYTEAEVVEMLEGVDFRHVGHITFEDFKAMMENRIASPRARKQIARSFCFPSSASKKKSLRPVESAHIDDGLSCVGKLNLTVKHVESEGSGDSVGAAEEPESSTNTEALEAIDKMRRNKGSVSVLPPTSHFEPSSS